MRCRDLLYGATTFNLRLSLRIVTSLSGRFSIKFQIIGKRTRFLSLLTSGMYVNYTVAGSSLTVANAAIYLGSRSASRPQDSYIFGVLNVEKLKDYEIALQALKIGGKSGGKIVGCILGIRS